METSAKNGFNVNKLFNQVVQILYEKTNKKKINEVKYIFINFYIIFHLGR